MFISYPHSKERGIFAIWVQNSFFHKKLDFFRKLCYFYSIPSYFMLPYSV